MKKQTFERHNLISPQYHFGFSSFSREEDSVFVFHLDEKIIETCFSTWFRRETYCHYCHKTEKLQPSVALSVLKTSLDSKFKLRKTIKSIFFANKKATKDHEKAIKTIKGQKDHNRSLKAMLGCTWPHISMKTWCN